MKMINFACALESFRIEPAGRIKPATRTEPAGSDGAALGASGDEMRIEGWLLGHPTPARLDLVFGGARPARFEIRSRERPSVDVQQHFGATFGEAAWSCRFLLAERVPVPPPDWNRAALRMTGRDGTVVEIRLDPPERIAPDTGAASPERDLVARFENCGDNPEFGLLQHGLGCDRLSLLRDAGVADVFALAHAIERRFAGFADGAAIQVHAHAGAWVAALPALRMNFHTGRRVADVTADRVRGEERDRLPFLARQFIADIEAGGRIFVYRTRRDARGGGDGMKGCRRLHEALRAIGPARLLWVNEADADHPPGAVRELGRGLYHGHAARLAPHHDPAATDVGGWLALLAAAASLIDRAPAAGAPDEATA